MISPQDSRLIAAEIVRLQRHERWYMRWKIMTFVLALSLITLYIATRPAPADPGHIAVVNIAGSIDADSNIWQQLERVNLDNAKGMLVLINSGGGVAGDCERLYNELRYIGKQIPIEIMVENMAASGAYLAALAGDKIYAYHNSMIGSVGVVLQHITYGKLLEKYGVELERIAIGKYKGYPSNFDEMPPEVRKHFEELLSTDRNWFVNLVKERRGLSSTSAYDEAQIISASQALDAKLIDGISTRAEAIERLREVAGDYPLKHFDREPLTWAEQFFGPKRAWMPSNLFETNLLAG